MLEKTISRQKKILFIVYTTLGGVLLLIPLALIAFVLYTAYDLMVMLARTTGIGRTLESRYLWFLCPVPLPRQSASSTYCRIRPS